MGPLDFFKLDQNLLNWIIIDYDMYCFVSDISALKISVKSELVVIKDSGMSYLQYVQAEMTVSETVLERAVTDTLQVP